jgi:hypothetical protein
MERAREVLERQRTIEAQAQVVEHPASDGASRIQSHCNASRASRICRVARHRRGIFEEAVQGLPERAEIVAPSRALVNYLPQQIVVGPGQKLDLGDELKAAGPRDRSNQLQQIPRGTGI